jgi:hypothetical protein
MKDKRYFIGAVMLAAGVLLASAQVAGEARFEFPTTGVSATGGALLLAIDDALLPLRANLCYYLSRPSIRREPVVEPSRNNPAAPDHLAAHFWSAPLVVPAGGLRVVLNAQGARGIRVELADARFAPVARFSAESSGSAAADGLESVVTWPAGGLGALGGRTVRLRIRMRKEDGVEPRLYAVYLRPGL